MTSSVIKNKHDERLDMSFHPASERETLVILGHGVTGNKDRPLMVAVAEGLAARGWPCMRISFAGNGDSEGRFEDATITKEISDLKSVLESVPDYVQVIYVGHSMGSAVGVMTAANDLRIRALVSLAGMTHTAAFATREFGAVTPDEGCMWEDENCPLSADFMDDMKSIGDILAVAKSVVQPWLLIHGTADDVVPIQDGRDAFAAAECSKQWLAIEGAEHSFGDSSYPQIIDAVDAWISASLA